MKAITGYRQAARNFTDLGRELGLIDHYLRDISATGVIDDEHAIETAEAMVRSLRRAVRAGEAILYGIVNADKPT